MHRHTQQTDNTEQNKTKQNKTEPQKKELHKEQHEFFNRISNLISQYTFLFWFHRKITLHSK